MAKKKPAKKKASSWHSIKQSSAGRGQTKVARKRRWAISLRMTGAVLAILVVLWAIGGGLYLLNTKSDKLSVVGASGPLRNIYFQTDGVLTREWLMERLDLPDDIALADVNIEAIRSQLAEEGQTREVSVEKRFPDALMVSVKERRPVQKLVIVDASGRKGLWLVDAEGVVYRGAHYAIDQLEPLPFLDVAQVARQGNRYGPVPGVETVCELMNQAQIGYPEIYSQWRIISLRDFSGDPEELGATIRVVTRDKHEIIFSPTGFDGQLERLRKIYAHLEEKQIGPVRRIDLSFQEPIIKLAQGQDRTRRYR
ncbi:FtsQ-type POTRA domain-containing protein [Ruficoccus sp. ZRK36]|uniref:cell division protein FtsQ/DivIB n=1 Tax=Ruficoccus sp. ZRK36 TaxID=2866311 RepID=UPI001C73CCED|nr:FtsQ-type POTRA domain-containing protein [Ruficoccus sp. ZRK36]QYY35773.1 FtsQ-type POTRA domain-containing protein [Ruficoccus sp. ZRK36]